MSDPNSLYSLSFTDINGNEVDLEPFRGKPVLIVNTASKCGFTPQYEGLQKLHEELGPLGLVVLGFPCDQFGHQEPGDNAQIEEFCSTKFKVSFPLAAKIDVNGTDTHPVFKFVKEHSDAMLGSRIKWNFTKFLVSPDGTTVQRFAPTTKPADLTPEIQKLLAANG
ncbi:MAG: glutathione peroxidase [Candidatus Nanopelagicales bacterium]|nr:glutathione peroxidase [Candidatus Nanopelagicales bacterium]